MPPKKAAPAALIPSKESVFMPKRVMVSNKRMDTKTGEKQNFVGGYVKPKRYLFEQGTQEPYAELIGNTAVCLVTGMDLFTLNGGESDLGYFDSVSSFSRKYDFTPPGGVRHPADRFVDVQNLVKAGIISEADVANQRAFTDQELSAAMKELESYGLGECSDC